MTDVERKKLQDGLPAAAVAFLVVELKPDPRVGEVVPAGAEAMQTCVSFGYPDNMPADARLQLIEIIRGELLTHEAELRKGML